LIKYISNRQHSVLPIISAETQENITNDNLMILVSVIILQLGIPVNTKGYAYLREAIIIMVNEAQSDIPITKILYPQIAKEFHTSAICVERAIRHAIEAAWNRTDPFSRDKVFPYTFSHLERRPTNSAFITMIADHIVLLYN